MEINLVNLNKDYLQGKIVPFIGAGLSAPFKVPTWRGLIENIADKYTVLDKEFVKNVVDHKLKVNDYWAAIDYMKDLLTLTDQDIQTEIVTMINGSKIRLEDITKHNYHDIAQMNFNLFLTTNYENLLFDYVRCENLPLQMREINFNTQDLFDSRRIMHLHGYTSNPGSIVISRSSYQDLYENNKYKNLLKLVTGTKKLLFMGFSFDDQFIRQLIKDHKEDFQGNHYIILNDPPEEKVKELKEEYGLVTIKYNSANSSHSEEIRKILAIMSEQSSEENPGGSKKGSESTQPIILGAQITDMGQNVESNLFYKKLQIENIKPGLLKLSSIFYVAAESYIRQLKNSGMSVEVINAVLRKVFIKYNEKYSDTYEKHGDSQQFVEVVHKTLEDIDLGRLAKLFSDNQISDEDENRGLIHILADDEKIDIWWGEKRLK